MSKDVPANPITDVLEKYKKIVWREIDKYLQDPEYPTLFTIPKKYKSNTKLQWKIIRDYPERRGKYIRPTLVILSSLSMGGSLAKTLKTAAAMQLSEEWLLIHDDIEDGSIKRRGKPTLHRIYGPELAINAGDMLQTIMWKALNDNISILDRKTYKKIMDEFYTMLTRTILGQGIEITWTKMKMESFDDEDWYFLADGKTSYYTITHPLRLGAIIAGANNSQLDKINPLGLTLGRAFQLVDDILDVTTNFSGLKIQGNDIYEGKKTILLGHLLRRASLEDKKRIINILQKDLQEKTREEVNWVIEKMHTYGSIEYAKKLAEKYKEEALGIFENNLKFFSIQPYRDQIKQLIAFIVERQY
jgi:geranylgeranyl diphosphate synthase type II